MWYVIPLVSYWGLLVSFSRKASMVLVNSLTGLTCVNSCLAQFYPAGNVELLNEVSLHNKRGGGHSVNFQTYVKKSNLWPFNSLTWSGSGVEQICLFSGKYPVYWWFRSTTGISCVWCKPDFVTPCVTRDYPSERPVTDSGWSNVKSDDSNWCRYPYRTFQYSDTYIGLNVLSYQTL